MYFRKSRSRREQLTEDGELPERIIKGGNVLTNFPILDRLALAEAIDKLSPGYRAVFVLHDVEGLQHLEIANILGCAVGTSKSQLHKARMKMRCLLRQPTHPNYLLLHDRRSKQSRHWQLTLLHSIAYQASAETLCARHRMHLRNKVTGK